MRGPQSFGSACGAVGGGGGRSVCVGRPRPLRATRRLAAWRAP